MFGQRIAVASVVAAIISLNAVAQTSDTGPITFPPTTDTFITSCSSFVTLPGPGGNVIFLDGGFFKRNGAIYFGTFPNQGNGCTNQINIQFAPAATDITFTLTSFAAQVIFVPGSPVSYNLPRNGSVAITLPGPQNGLIVIGSSSVIPFAISGLSITQHPLNQGFVQFDLNSSIPSTSDQTKILMSKAIWDIGYPSTAQVAPDSAGNPQVRIAGTLRDKITGQPKSGAVFLRVTDPRDTASYRGADAHDGDNSGTAVLSSPSVQADAQGRFEATLVVRSRTAGDNFQIVGATNEKFNCTTVCPRSAVLTLWKRTYVENVAMFRNGTFIMDGADAGTTDFDVSDGAPFQGLSVGAPLKLIHADSGQGEGYYWEIVYFKGVGRNAAGQWHISVDSDAALSGQGIARDYGTSVGGAHAPNYYPWASLVRDAIGIIDAGTYTAATSFVEPTLADAFVEMKEVPVVIDAVPHLDNVPPLPDSIQYADHWFEHSEGSSHHAMPNTFHRIAANQNLPVHVPGAWTFDLGVTIVGGGNNASFIFDQRIDDLAAGRAFAPDGTLLGPQYRNTSAAVVNARTTAHETVHFWIRSQRTGITDSQGHCQADQFDDPALTCLMHQAAGANGLDSASIHMHYLLLANGGVDSEYMIIRNANDPVPQN
jgi:hypothetical protein